MPHWMIKAATQRAIGLFPFRHTANELLQNYITGSVSLTEQQFEFKLDEARQHLDNFWELRPEAREGFTAFEVGPGWYPTLAVGMYLCGAGKIWTCDIAPLLRLERVLLFLEKIGPAYDSGKLAQLLPRVMPERVEHLREVLRRRNWKTVDELLQQLNIHIHVADARFTGLPDESIDFVVTIGVLLHIPRFILRDILLEFRRIGKPNMVQSHFIDMMDLFAYFDKSISPLNFLKFSDRTWSWIDNPIIPMNRLRISDYRDLFAETGFEITREIHTFAQPADLERVPLAAEFRNYSTEDLLTLMSYVVSRKAEPACVAVG